MKLEGNQRIKNNRKGITLIALVITIIILLILAGVSIATLTGEGGILTKAKTASEINKEEETKEKLKLALVEARTEKETNELYNSQIFLEKLLKMDHITLEGDIAIVDNYHFIVDREKLIILESLGEMPIKISKEVTSYRGKNANEKYEVELLLKIESEEEIKSAEIKKPDGTIENIAKEEIQKGKKMVVELDVEYDVIARMENDKTATRKIVEQSEERIHSVEELVAFRDKVSKGLSYQGKKIKLANDIDLSSVCYKVDGTKENDISWEPIGKNEAGVANRFNGEFDGQNHVIDHLYINTTENNQGFFGMIDADSKILNCIIKGEVTAGRDIGGIVRK